MSSLKIIFFLTCLLTLLSQYSNSCLAQGTTDAQLASFYYQNEEYDRALLYYEKLHREHPTETTYFKFYLNSLLKTSQHDQAVKVVKKQIKRQPSQSD